MSEHIPHFEMSRAGRGTIAGRLAKLCWLVALAFIVFGVFRAYGHDKEAVGFAFIWFFMAACVLGFAGFIAALRWVFLGSR